MSNRDKIMAARRAQPGWTELHEEWTRAQEEITEIQHLRDRADFNARNVSARDISSKAWDELITVARDHEQNVKKDRAAKRRSDITLRIQQMSDTARREDARWAL